MPNGTRRGKLPEVTRGTISETRNESQYIGHWRVANDALMVKLGITVETVPSGGRTANPEVIARHVFSRVIDRHVAKSNRSR
jgi:uncharacterized protein YycO